MASIPTSWRVWSWRVPARKPFHLLRRPHKGVWGRGQLHRCGVNGWQFQQGRQPAFSHTRIRHVWQAPWWLTITFQSDPQASAHRLTVWRFGLGARSWRGLCLWVWRDLSMEPVATRNGVPS